MPLGGLRTSLHREMCGVVLRRSQYPNEGQLPCHLVMARIHGVIARQSGRSVSRGPWGSPCSPDRAAPGVCRLELCVHLHAYCNYASGVRCDRQSSCKCKGMGGPGLVQKRCAKSVPPYRKCGIWRYCAWPACTRSGALSCCLASECVCCATFASASAAPLGRTHGAAHGCRLSLDFGRSVHVCAVLRTRFRDI